MHACMHMIDLFEDLQELTPGRSPQHCLRRVIFGGGGVMVETRSAEAFLTTEITYKRRNTQVISKTGQVEALAPRRRAADHWGRALEPFRPRRWPELLASSPPRAPWTSGTRKSLSYEYESQLKPTRLCAEGHCARRRSRRPCIGGPVGRQQGSRPSGGS